MITVHHEVKAELDVSKCAGLQSTVTHIVKVTISGRATLLRLRTVLLDDERAVNGPRRRALIESLRTAKSITLTMPVEKWEAIEATIGT